eukprot:CAMPEP_0197438428 /NCGR_PEP_ID=MMETSP1175-20131217/5430_1 /TAXON_ID=1003142 /ORGANISM="Triceratium dubium, Strain CCMP147" /LENGTH=332 /DNA_ID=CAMNT_0042968161 /DNA_START=108 /DNA_END=1109 /DNA_ORIENTATION=+
MTSVRMRSLLRSASNPTPSSATAESVARSLAPLADEASVPITYSRLIARQDWDAVREALSTDAGRLRARCEMEGDSSPLSSSSSPDDDDGHVDGGTLHFACRFHPPPDVVLSLLELLPDSVRHTDNLGRYPLHVAAKWGASPRVVKFLIEGYPDAAGLQDAMGKTPLHLACESYASKYSSQKAEGRPLREAIVEVVRRICRAAPDAVNLEDMDDMTALEYAIEADVELKVVRSIQKACEKDWKHRRELPGASHETVQRSLLEQREQNSQRLRTDLLQHASQSRNLTLPQQDVNDLTAAATRISLSKAAGTTRHPAPLQQPPRKKPSTRALMA